MNWIQANLRCSNEEIRDVYSGELSALNDYLGRRRIDALLCCASFEERCRVIPETVEVDKISHLWVSFNREFERLSKPNLEALESRYQGSCTVMELGINDPIVTADCFANHLEELCRISSARIVVDITSFTRESLLILIKFLSERMSEGQSLEFLYLRAKEYSVGDPPQHKWLSKGNREVRSVLGFPGAMVPSRGNHLIVLVGFEDERALSVVRECEPSLISLGVGDETEWATAPHQDTNITRLRRLQSMLGRVNVFAFRGYDANSTKRTVQGLIETKQAYNTILAPMNTKISTLGAAMVALEDESIQVCYAQADVYNTKNYSAPGEHFFHLSLEELG